MNEPETKHRRSIGKEIGFISRSSHIYFQHQFKNYSIGHAQVITLHHICKHNGLNQHELVNHFNLDKSSVTSQISILEKNGYISREKNKDDSRERKIYITEKTEAIQNNLKEKFSGWTDIMLDGFREEEKEELFSLMGKLKENVERAIKKLKEDEKKK